VQVTAAKGWAAVGRKLGAPYTVTNASFQLKRLYERYLLSYEEVSGVRGCWLAG
jgi:hypothetical protein